MHTSCICVNFIQDEFISQSITSLFRSIAAKKGRVYVEKFYCSAKEFYFNREFSNFVSSGEGKLKEELEDIQTKHNGRAYTIVLSGIITLALLFIVTRIGEFALQTTLRNGLIAIFLVLMISFYVQLYKGRKEYARYRDRYFNAPATLKENVLYYVLSAKGIYINDFNRSDIADMTLVPWEKIEKAELDFLRSPYVRGGTHSKAKDVFQSNIKSIGKEHHGFDIEARDIYEDRYALRFFYKEGKGSHSSIAIPKEWRETGEEARFIDEVAAYIEVERSPALEA